MKVLAAFSKPEEAHLLRSHLEGSGIAAFVRDDHTVTQDWALSNAIGGVRVEVAEEDFEAACALVAEFAPAPPAPAAEPASSPRGTKRPRTFGRYLKLFLLVFAGVFAFLAWRSHPAPLETYGIILIPSFILGACCAGFAALLDL